ncbi:M23 family metallopeptidase [Kribbella antibiotica]|uniref:M23 family metallopeptidase n=2 Tax=Kribbella antibiotica TaxID=190195 RepID=A0A4R4ZHV9_9ACTN|nr:M23 family metallopeptidase [Kribbella antibiotica]
MSLPADASDCGPPSGGGKAFSWPTTSQKVDVPFKKDKHEGLDFNVPLKSPVVAVDSGTVIKNADNEIWIEHEKGVQYRYQYFTDLTAKVGTKVARGDQIGTSGSGDEADGAKGPHLHFALWVAEGNEKGEGKLVAIDPGVDSFGDEATGPSGDSGDCGCGAGGPLVGSNEQQQAFNYFVSSGYTKEQAAGIVGNMIHESAVKPMRLQNTAETVQTKAKDAEGNSLGWGIVQWTPASKIISNSRKGGVPYEQIETLAYQLDFLRRQLAGETVSPEKAAGQGLHAATTPEDAAYAFGHLYERFAGHENPNAPTYGVRKTSARKVFELYKGGTGVPGSGPATSCSAGSGNIAAVAMKLAWPTDGHDGLGTNASDATVAKPEYVAAMKQYNDPGGLRAYTDCGRFVATVMHMSGADPKFPKVSTGVQFDYMQNSGKYDFWHAVPPGGMKPGDILNGPGHTYLYVGPWGAEGKGYNAAAASLYGHVPEAGHLYAVGGQFWVFRLKAPPTPAGPPAEPKA